ncbi:hypothetical protein [Psychrobacter sp. AOP31-A1-22]|uniref:hypothetical protein n=1 Tax=Psychrobacter sp. AOP31-A1-22 TaxID=3457696 RepID=UPI0040355206
MTQKVNSRNDIDSNIDSVHDLWKGLLEEAEQAATTTATVTASKSVDDFIDGNSSAPAQPYADILYILESYQEKVGYISMMEKTGRPFPNAVILEGLQSDLFLIKSASADMSFDDMLDEVLELIDEHYEDYGAMLTQDVFDDLSDFDHLQSGIVVPPFSSNSHPETTPIMGLSAFNIALKRLKVGREEPVKTAGNLLMLSSETNEDDISFAHTLVGHGSLCAFTSYLNEIGLQSLSLLAPGEDGYDDYYDQLAGVHITAATLCPTYGETLNFQSTVAEKPLEFLGFTQMPTMWGSILSTHYASNADFHKSSDLILKYQDVFYFWLAAASGMPLEYFHSFKGRTSSFHKLPEAQKAEVLINMAPLVDDAALNMQSLDYLATSPLLNIYE